MKPYRLPNKKRNLLTKEFLIDFRDELIKLENEYEEKHNNHRINWNTDCSYYGFFGEIESTGMFYDALKTVCKKYNVIKAIYEYACKLEWYDSDIFDDEIVLEMVRKGIIPEKTGKEYEDMESYNYEHYEAKYKIVKHRKGYDVVEYGRWLKDDKQSLEYIYKDSEEEIIWLD